MQDWSLFLKESLAMSTLGFASLSVQGNQLAASWNYGAMETLL